MVHLAGREGASGTGPQDKPFIQNSYYPPKPSSFGIRPIQMPGQVLSVPYSQFSSMATLSGTMQNTIGSFPAFKFQPRRECIDWRRFSAIDVDRVARELDVATLQENISSVTFCNLDAEKCPYCQQPVDPVLLKVLRMAQLTIEYLLHSQEYLSSNLVMMEEKLQCTMEEQERSKNEMCKVAEELKAVKEESKRRKKMISTQQLLIQAGANNYHKCQLCDKAFMNFSYLQGHLERRHPEVTAVEKQKKKQVMQMEDGIEELKVKLQKTQALLEEEKEAEHRRRMQEMEEIRHREEEGKREFERWKEEERAKFQKEMDSLKQLFLTEFRGIASKNTTLEDKVHELESRKVVSNLGELRDDSGKRERELTQQELQDLRETIESQKTEWKRKLKDIQKVHEHEREELMGENERLRASLSKDQKTASDHFRHQLSELSSQIKDQGKIIKTQEETIRKLTSLKAEVTVKPEVMYQHHVKPVEKKWEDVEEMESTEDEPEHIENRKTKIPDALRRDPNLVKQLRPVLEQALEDKMESMGVRKAAKGIPTQTLRNIKAILQTQQDQKATKSPDFMSLRGRLTKSVTRKVKEWQKSGSTLQSEISMNTINSQRTLHTRSHSQSLTPKQRKVQVIESKPRLSEPPKPSPRSKVPSPATTPRSAAPAVNRPTRLSTPPFTSEEESMGDKSFLTSPKSKPREISRPTQPIQKKQVSEMKMEEWSDTDFSDDNVSPTFTSLSRGPTEQGSKVHTMARSIEQQLNGQRKKPVGGVSHAPSPAAASTPNGNMARKLQLLDEDSDLEISSFDEITEQLGTNEKPRTNMAPQPAVRLSADSAGSQGTSIWSSSSTRTGGW